MGRNKISPRYHCAGDFVAAPSLFCALLQCLQLNDNIGTCDQAQRQSCSSHHHCEQPHFNAPLTGIINYPISFLASALALPMQNEGVLTFAALLLRRACRAILTAFSAGGFGQEVGWWALVAGIGVGLANRAPRIAFNTIVGGRIEELALRAFAQVLGWARNIHIEHPGSACC